MGRRTEFRTILDIIGTSEDIRGPFWTRNRTIIVFNCPIIVPDLVPGRPIMSQYVPKCPKSVRRCPTQYVRLPISPFYVDPTTWNVAVSMVDAGEHGSPSVLHTEGSVISTDL